MFEFIGLLAWSFMEWARTRPHSRRYVAYHAPSTVKPAPYAGHGLPSRISTARQQPPWDGVPTAPARATPAVRRRPVMASSSPRLRRSRRLRP